MANEPDDNWCPASAASDLVHLLLLLLALLAGTIAAVVVAYVGWQYE